MPEIWVLAETKYVVNHDEIPHIDKSCEILGYVNSVDKAQVWINNWLEKNGGSVSTRMPGFIIRATARNGNGLFIAEAKCFSEQLIKKSPTRSEVGKQPLLVVSM